MQLHCSLEARLCNLLKNIELPNDVSEVRSMAFADCKSLETFVCNEGLLTIGNKAFENCTSLKRILLSKTLTNIGEQVFNLVGHDLEVYIYGGSKAVEWARIHKCNIKNANSFIL